MDAHRNFPALPQHRRVVLVRHAASLPDPHRPPKSWLLSESGEKTTRYLPALALFEHVSALYAGPERKQQETFEPLARHYGLPVRALKAFAESGAMGWLEGEQFLETIRRFFAAPEMAPAPGWETARMAAERFAHGIDQLLPHFPPVVYQEHALPGMFAVSSGGRVLIAYLQMLEGWSGEDAFKYWERLRMPDIAVLEFLEGGESQIVIPFGVLLSEVALE
ncbi:MAG: histidine phosphatase family protein [Chloroflexi bacterium]|nr:histidine phosphatase family protein [Chloroflexota bacterium]